MITKAKERTNCDVIYFCFFSRSLLKQGFNGLKEVKHQVVCVAADMQQFCVAK